MAIANEYPDLSIVPNHVAIIMDGNGRWARDRKKPHIEGHRAGAKSVRQVVEDSLKVGVRYLTLYTFSSENWRRPQLEVSGLMMLFERYLKSEIDELVENGVRLRVIGDIDKLPVGVRRSIDSASEKSSGQNKLTLVLAVSYGGRAELVNACQKVAQNVLDGDFAPKDIDQDIFSSKLYTQDIPDPDLMIRTSGEHRISNFLLWQLAYAELYFTNCYWPDFTSKEFCKALESFERRDRRFGKTGVQLEENKTGVHNA